LESISGLLKRLQIRALDTRQFTGPNLCFRSAMLVRIRIRIPLSNAGEKSLLRTVRQKNVFCRPCNLVSRPDFPRLNIPDTKHCLSASVVSNTDLGHQHTLTGSVVDAHVFNVDPDSVFYRSADPDPGSKTNADPEHDHTRHKKLIFKRKL
jgi:hypothetical protein